MKNNKVRKKQPARKTVLIVCEDEKSCKYYLEEIYKKYKENYRQKVTIKIKKGTAKNAKIKYGIADETYIVLDKEKGQEPLFEKSIEIAKKENYITIVSVPCYEYWLLLHFECSTSPFRNCAEIEEKLNKHLKSQYEKGSCKQITDYFLPEIETALCNAKKIAKNTKEEMDYPNPSTQLHTLIQTMKELANIS